MASLARYLARTTPPRWEDQQQQQQHKATPAPQRRRRRRHRHVVIAGAGPAGLLLTALLMQRNEELPEPLYRVTLVDSRQDLSRLSVEELKKKFRSWLKLFIW